VLSLNAASILIINPPSAIIFLLPSLAIWIFLSNSNFFTVKGFQKILKNSSAKFLYFNAEIETGEQLNE